MPDHLTDEEKKLLAASDGASRRGRKSAPREDLPEAAAASPERGPHTPAQYDDDGWGDTPVQMRG